MPKKKRRKKKQPTRLGTSIVNTVTENYYEGTWSWSEAWAYIQASFRRTHGQAWFDANLSSESNTAFKAMLEGKPAFKKWLTISAGVTSKEGRKYTCHRVSINYFAQKMRENPTSLEAQHYAILEGMEGVAPFRIVKQRPVHLGRVGTTIIDALIYAKGNVYAWEIDGPYHDGKARKQKDLYRDQALKVKGIKTIRTHYKMNKQEVKQALMKHLKPNQ